MDDEAHPCATPLENMLTQFMIPGRLVPKTAHIGTQSNNTRCVATKDTMFFIICCVLRIWLHLWQAWGPARLALRKSFEISAVRTPLHLKPCASRGQVVGHPSAWAGGASWPRSFNAYLFSTMRNQCETSAKPVRNPMRNPVRNPQSIHFITTLD